MFHADAIFIHRNIVASGVEYIDSRTPIQPLLNNAYKYPELHRTCTVSTVTGECVNHDSRAERMYDACDQCNYDNHVCPGCGENLSHSGHQYNGTLHGSRCVD